jgi:homocysteine S-methyltransferase
MLADGSEYRGDYGLSVQQLMDFHRPRLAVLAASGADLLACETLPCPEEAEALARLLQDEFPQTPAWFSFSCRDGEHVWQGERLADCMAMLESVPQVVAVGVNCTDPRWVESLLRQAASVTASPCWPTPIPASSGMACTSAGMASPVPTTFLHRAGAGDRPVRG